MRTGPSAQQRSDSLHRTDPIAERVYLSQFLRCASHIVGPVSDLLFRYFPYMKLCPFREVEALQLNNAVFFPAVSNMDSFIYSESINLSILVVNMSTQRRDAIGAESDCIRNPAIGLILNFVTFHLVSLFSGNRTPVINSEPYPLQLPLNALHMNSYHIRSIISVIYKPNVSWLYKHFKIDIVLSIPLRISYFADQPSPFNLLPSSLALVTML